MKSVGNEMRVRYTVGSTIGADVGAVVGADVGAVVRADVGAVVGADVGAVVGEAVGEAVESVHHALLNRVVATVGLSLQSAIQSFNVP